jgi:hypothetical protein
MIEAVTSDAATKTVSYWLPLITAFGGLVSGVILEWLRDKRTYGREREAREAARRDARTQKRNEFQRQTLLDLQDSVMKLMQTTAAAHQSDMTQYGKNGIWQKVRYSDEINKDSQFANAQSAILGVRERNDDVRELLQLLKSETTTVVRAKSREESEKAIQSVGRLFVSLNDQIGRVLRSMDDNKMA